MGKGVATAVSNVNDRIASKLVGMDPTDQKGIDDAMLAIDGTENKARYARDHAEIDDAMLAIDGTENKARYTRDHAEIWTRDGEIRSP